MLIFASKHDFFGQKTRFSDLTISRWPVVSEIDFIQIIKITPGPHLRDDKTIVVEFLYTRNTSLNLTLRYDFFFVHEFTSVHFLHHSMNKIFLKICITLGPNLRNNKTIVVEFLYTWHTSLNLPLRYNQYLVVHKFTFVHCLHHRMINIEFHFTCITHILCDFNNIQRIWTLRGNSFNEEVHPKPKLGMFCALPQKNNISILKQIVWKLESCIKFQWAPGVIWINQIKSRKSSSWVIDPNTFYHDLINNSRTTCPTEILMSFMNLTDNFASGCVFFFFKNVSIF